MLTIFFLRQAQQDLHFAQFFKILKLLGYEWADKLQHINFGMIMGMSTRKGTVKFLDDILDEAGEVMHEQMRKSEDKYAEIEDPKYTADILGQSAVKIQDMGAKRCVVGSQTVLELLLMRFHSIGNYKFDWSRMTSYLGDTGP